MSKNKIKIRLVCLLILNIFLFSCIVVNANTKTLKIGGYNYIYFEPLYDNVEMIGNLNAKDYFKVYQNGKSGVVDSNGNVILKPIYDDIKLMNFSGQNNIHFSGFLIVSNNKNGLTDINGKILLEPAFDDIKFMINSEADFAGFLIVSNNKKGLADINGNIILKPQYDNIELNEYKTNVKYLCNVTIDGKTFHVTKYGEYFNSYSTSIPQEDLIIIQKNEKEGLANSEGKIIAQPIFDYIDTDEYESGFFRVRINDKWGLIDKRGNFIAQPIYDYIGSYDNGLYKASLNGKRGILYKDGNFVHVPIFDTFGSMGEFHEGLAWFPSEGKIGFIDVNGSIKISPQFDNARNFYKGVAPVCWYIKNGKDFQIRWGLIDVYGNIILKPTYDDIQDFSEGLAVVTLNGKMGYIDTNGHIVFSLMFDEAQDFRKGMAYVTINGKDMLLLKDGTLIDGNRILETVGPDFNKQFTLVNINGHVNIYNKEEGKMILPTDYDSAYIDSDLEDKLRSGKYPDEIRILLKKGEIYKLFDLGQRKWLLEFQSKKFEMMRVEQEIPGNLKNPAFSNIEGSSYYKYGVSKMGVYDLKNQRIVIKPQYDDIYLIKNYKKLYFLVKDKNKYGLLDESGKVLLEPLYDKCMSYMQNENLSHIFSDKYNIVGFFNNGNIVLYDLNRNKIILNSEIDDIKSFGNNLFLIYKNEKIGLMDTNLNIISKPQYDNIETINDYLFIVKKGGKYNLMNKSGKLILQSQSGAAVNDLTGLDGLDDDEKYLKINVNNKIGVIDSKGNIIAKPEYDKAVYLQKDLIGIKKGSKWMLVDGKGKTLFVLNNIDQINPYKEGIARVEKIIQVQKNSFNWKTISKYGYINTKGQMIAECRFDSAYDFHEGLAAVGIVDKTNIKYGYIDKNGKLIIKYQFDNAKSFANGLAAVKLNNKWGFIDKTGKMVITPKFDEVKSFEKNGLAIVRQNGKWSVINKSGKFIINRGFDDLSIIPPLNTANGGLIIAENIIKDINNYSYTIYTSEGKMLYDNVSRWYTIRKPNQQDIISGIEFLQGSKLYRIDLNLNDIVSLYDSFMVVKVNGKYGIKDYDGNFILKAEYDSIEGGFDENYNFAKKPIVVKKNNKVVIVITAN